MRLLRLAKRLVHGAVNAADFGVGFLVRQLSCQFGQFGLESFAMLQRVNVSKFFRNASFREWVGGCVFGSRNWTPRRSERNERRVERFERLFVDRQQIARAK